MIIKRANDGETFILTMESELGVTHINFTGIAIESKCDHVATVMYREDHKATILLTDKAAFWEAARNAGLNPYYISSSPAKEGIFQGEAA